MLNQSKELLDAVFAPIKLSSEFPVSELDHTIRAETPIEAHVHDCLEIGYCVSGSGIFLVENKILSFRAGDAVIINHRELHTMKGSPGANTDWYFLNLAPVPLLAPCVREDEAWLETECLSGADFSNILASEHHGELCSLIAAIIEEIRERKPGFHSVVRAQVWELMVRLHRLAPQQVNNEFAPGPVERKKLGQITPAIRHITRHYQENVTMETLARKCGCSVSNFRKVFHAATGYSPQDYLKRLRLEAVIAMLRHTNDEIISIALRAGYQTLSNFNRQFRAQYGMSPREWRNLHQ
ncbi:MAG: helix-turn-helix transcriptional regulator [Victivallales bacterium]|nr:helix-turn-helix transcriptional regulator [Victivallales bacterium]